MVRKKMGYFIGAAAVVGFLYLGWKLTSRSAYETAEYTVVKSDGPIELREYPDLVLVTTEMSGRISGGDGSFGRLFGYISGGNAEEQKVAMTTPVFMDPKTDDKNGRMGFVIPKDVAQKNAPSPASDRVKLAERPGGTFAVIRFGGRAESQWQTQQSKLEAWIEQQGLATEGDAEVASYDPPWTPGMLRRNEILIRVAQ